MIRPSIQPDEPFAGYWPRVARWNGFEPAFTAQEFKTQFLERGAPVRFGTTNIERIAGIAGVAIGDLIHRHSMVPLVCSFRTDGVSSRAWSDRDANDIGLGKLAFLSTRDNEIFLCPCCVEEDLAALGFSFWRRNHQIAGAYWCLKHACSLRRLNGSPVVTMLRAPSLHLTTGNSNVVSATKKLSLNEPIRRVLELQSQLLGLARPLSRERVHCIARKRAEEIGLRQTKAGHQPLLSELVLDTLGSAWLNGIYHTTTNIQRRTKLSSFDMLKREHIEFAPIAYAIMFSVMWESSDEAFAAMCDESITVPLRRGNPPQPTDKQILQTYKETLGSSTKMTAQLGICLQTLKSRLTVLELPSLYGRRKMALAEVLLYRKDPEEIARHWELPRKDLQISNPQSVEILRKVLKKLMVKEPSDSRLTKQRNAIYRGDFTTYATNTGRASV